MKNMNFKAAIFDLDGTLIDPFNAWKGSFRKTLALMNHQMTEGEFINLYLMTFDETRVFLYKIYESQKLDKYISFESIMENLTYEMEKQYAFEIQEKPHALEFVQTLYDLNIPICVATLTARNFAEKALNRLGFMPYLQFIITGDDVGLSKKFADIYLRASERLGFLPHETMVFEDCLTAARTAYKADFIVCGVTDQHQSHSIEDMYPYCHWSITNYMDACMAVS